MTVMIRPTMSVWGRCYTVIAGIEDQPPVLCQQYFDFNDAIKAANSVLLSAEQEAMPNDDYFTKVSNERRKKKGL